MPVRLTDCWLPAVLLLLSVMIKVAVRVQLAAGVKVTLTEQFAPPASELPHVVVSANSLASAPEKAIPLIDSATFPVLFSVKLCAVLVVPRFWLANTRLDVEMPAIGALPVPLRLIT